MSIATEIKRLQNAKSSIKSAIENKGVEVGSGTIETYASKIDEIQMSSSGITPSGTIEITENGTYDVSTYQRANVNVAGDTTFEDGIVDGTLTGTYTNNRITTVGVHRFRSSQISVFNSTSLKKVSQYGFYQATLLEELNTPNLKDLTEGNSFIGCSSLKRLYLPYVSGLLGGSIFSACSELTYAYLGKIATIASGAFNNCVNLTTLVLPNTTMVSLNNVNALSTSAIGSGTGYIYVPKALLEDYKVATNWSTFASQFRAIEDYPEIVGGVE